MPAAVRGRLPLETVTGGRVGEEAVSYFQGLRQYKEKFLPLWHPKYLASPGGFALPRILAAIAALISRNP
ncbi:MAG: hypothetical protein HUU20_07360 [Pirellulales bacterium]|nr:hypothetical protein [Pirellulales bacterium]